MAKETPKKLNTSKTSEKPIKEKSINNLKVHNSEINKLSKIYDRDYFENGVESKKSNYKDYDWDRLKNYFRTTAKHIVDKFKPSTSLDVGCAKGYLVNSLVELGVDSRGIDPSKYALSNVHPNIKDKFLLGMAQSIPFPENHFDVVTCFDVLEHIPKKDISNVLKEMLRVSKQWLVIRVVTKELENDIDLHHEPIQSIDWWHKQIKSAGAEIVPIEDYIDQSVWWFNVPEFLIIAKKVI